VARTAGCAPVELAGALVDTIVAAIGPGEPIAWVTVLDRSNLEASGWFNRALRRRAAVDPLFILIDWYELGVDHPEWFKDHVHHNLDGVDSFAGLYLDSFRRLLDTVRGPGGHRRFAQSTTDSIGPTWRVERRGHVATVTTSLIVR
jgi:hypothetical protein